MIIGFNTSIGQLSVGDTFYMKGYKTPFKVISKEGEWSKVQHFRTKRVRKMTGGWPVIKVDDSNLIIRTVKRMAS